MELSRHFCGLFVIVGVLVFTTNALAGGWRIIGRDSSSGTFSAAAASGDAKHPHQLAVRVTGQGARTGFAAVACTKSFDVGSASTNFYGPGIHLLRLPSRGRDSCSVTASVSGSGRLVVEILAR